jgi:outer membrane receptor protein involved in Fe transport
VNHEAEYVSHELQLFWDLSESVSFTSGIFFYDATIDQRYDFFTSTGAPQYTDPTWTLDSILATVAPGAVPGDPPLTFLFTQTGFPPAPIDVNFAEELAHANGLGNNQMQLATGPWLGDASLGVIPHGIASLGSDIHTLNKTEREAFAAYTQGVWDINELFTLTAGIRYAYDDIEGKENLSRYAESQALWSAPGAPFFGLLNLAIVNILRGAINPATL